MTDEARAWLVENADWSSVAPACRVAQYRPNSADADVLHSIRVGDARRALELLMTRHSDAVYRFCRSALADPSLADDVHQQTFVEAYRDLHRFEPRSTMRAWLLAIARHRVLDAMKARRRARGRLAEPDAAHEPATESSPDARLHTARLKLALDAVVADLPERTRTTVILRFQQDLTYEQLAALLGEAPGTLQRRVARALPVIRAALVRAGFSPTDDSRSAAETK